MVAAAELVVGVAALATPGAMVATPREPASRPAPMLAVAMNFLVRVIFMMGLLDSGEDFLMNPTMSPTCERTVIP